MEIRLLSYWKSLAFLNTETLAKISTPNAVFYKSLVRQVCTHFSSATVCERGDQHLGNSLDFPFLSLVGRFLPSNRPEPTDGTAAIIFTAARVRRQRPRTAIVGLRNERQFLQGRTMCRISALCWPVPPVLSRDTAIS